jgi:hypothetical protein
MEDDREAGKATPLSASALVLQDGTIITLAAEHRAGPRVVDAVLQLVEKIWKRAAQAIGAGIVLGVVVFLILPRTYEATLIVEAGTAAMMVEQSNRSGGILSGGVRSLIGGSGAMPQTTKDFLELLHSKTVGGELLKDPVIRRHMFGRQWDEKTGTWRRPEGAVAAALRFLRSVRGRPPWQPPGPEEVKRYLEGHLKIAPLGDGSLQQVSIRSRNAEWSAYLLSHTVAAADQYLKAREAKRASTGIDYWQERLDRASEQDVRAALIQNIVDAQRRLVLTGGDLPYAVDIVDPVLTPKAPAGPKLFGVVVTCVLLSLFAAFTPVVWRKMGALWLRAIPGSRLPAWSEAGAPRRLLHDLFRRAGL